MNDRYISKTPVTQPHNQLFKPWNQPEKPAHHHHCHPDGGLHKLPRHANPVDPSRLQPDGTYIGWANADANGVGTTNDGLRAMRTKDVYVPSSKR